MWGNRLLKISFSLIIISTFIFQAAAQTGISSPYSSVGLGYLNNVNNLHNKMMGGIGIGTRVQSTINLLNPASLTAIDTNSFIFEGGMVAHYTTLKTENTSEPVSSAALDHLLFGFPVTKWWKSSIGLLPYSVVGYNVDDLSEDEDIGSILHKFEGSGGLSKFYWANAFQPIKSISIGVNASYIFGTTNRVQRVTFPDTAFRLSTKVENSVSIGDLYVELGVQYYKELKNDLSLVVGGIYSPKFDMNATGQYLARTYVGELGDVEIYRDTIDYIEKEGTVVIPAGYGIGFSLSKHNHWFIGADYKYDEWESFKSFERSDSLINSHTFAAGGQYIPNYNSNSYINRINYRLGMKFYQSYLDLRNTRINSFGMTFGVGLPLRSVAIRGSRSKINIGIEAGRRGTLENGLIQENFFNFYLGVSVNELWFLKRRYQ